MVDSSAIFLNLNNAKLKNLVFASPVHTI